MFATLPSNSSLTIAESLTFFALTAKFIVDIVSEIASSFEDNVAIRTVLEFPPKESFSIFVNTESRYGMWVAFVDNFYITMLREVNERFMLDASLSLFPDAWVDFCFSDPARSTKCIFEDLIEYSSVPSFLERVLITMLKIECEREDYLFILVSAVVLFFIPLSKQDNKSCSLSIFTSSRLSK